MRCPHCATTDHCLLTLYGDTLPRRCGACFEPMEPQPGPSRWACCYGAEGCRWETMAYWAVVKGTLRPMTEWREHPRYQAYQVSNDGRVRSVDRMVRNRWGGQHLVHGRELATFVRRGGYLGGNLSFEGQRLNFEVHVMAAEAWHGLRPPGMHVRHMDGNKLNNDPANLAWDTVSANMLDKVTHGTHHEAAKTHCPHGHGYTESNTYRAPSSPNKRQCRTCIRIREAQRAPRPRRRRGDARWLQDAK